MAPADRERFGRSCDALVHGGILTLLIFSPLAFGAVHPWARGTAQLLIAGMLLTWGAKLLRCGTTTAAMVRLRHWWAPPAVFGLLVLFQTVPLPPAVIRVLSPQTYALYRDNVPGWPSAQMFEVLDRTLEAGGDPDGALDPAPAVAVEDGNGVSSAQLRALVAPLRARGRWRPLSLYDERSADELVQFAALSTLFFCS